MLTLIRHGQTLNFDDSGFGDLPYVYTPLTAGKVYEEEFLEYVRSLGRVGEYVDVGAHLGTHSLWFAKMCPATRVHAIEPVGRYADVVRRNVAANELQAKVTVHQTGVARERGRATNYMSREHQIGFVDGDPVGVTECFDVVPMDDIVRGPVALIKLDVEGMEADVLRGAARILAEHRPVIFAEAQSWAAVGSIARALEPFGYQLTGRIFNASPTYEFSTDPLEGWAAARSAYARLHPLLYWGRRTLRGVVIRAGEVVLRRVRVTASRRKRAM
jgi:FkbM family methyltransferase